MQTEIEAKFLNVDHGVIRQKLKAVGASCDQPMRLMRRRMFDYPDKRFQKNNQNQRLRIRDEGDKVTVNYKAKNETPYDYEVETVVASFDEMSHLFQAIGLVPYSFQESKRETWSYKDVEIVLDVWPWLATYIEIEGSTESAIRAISEELGFNWKDAAFGSVDIAYMRQYAGMKDTESIGDLMEVRFDCAVPQWLNERKKL